MNAERRHLANVCIQLITECADTKGDMSDESHATLVAAVKSMRQAESWSLKNQERHEGKNKTTDTSISISRVALPALEKADAALADDDYAQVIRQLKIAASTDGTVPTPRRRKKS